jgi:hypothetical protein
VKTFRIPALDQVEIEVFDPTLSFIEGVLPTTRDFSIFNIALTGHFIGVAQSPEGAAQVYRVDPQTGEETLLTDVPSNVTDMAIVPAVPVFADAFIRSGASNTNEGASPHLRIQAPGKNRGLVSFDLSRLDRGGVARAMLILTISEHADNWGKKGVRTVDAHPLLTQLHRGKW